MDSQITSKFSLALVTGATSGIGEAVARLLAAKGIPLLLTGRNVNRLERIERELSIYVPVESLAADLSASEDLERLVHWMHEREPDLIVNSAGIGYYGLATAIEIADQVKLLQVNVEALTILTLEASKSLKKRKRPGVILNVSSAASMVIFPLFASYSASKAFVNRLSESLDAELHAYGIRVLTSCPGRVATEFSKRAGGGRLFSERSMTPEFAAEEIWNQISHGKRIRIFNWPYRLGIFIAKYLLPNWILVPILRNSIESLLAGNQVTKSK